MPTFKNYTMDQLQLPLSFDEIIPQNHLVRVVNSIVDSLSLDPLYDRYKKGGCPAYHPGMMLKVIIYSYSQKIYSSRQIAKALRENINFMWIAGGNKPDFRTINRFRLEMKDIIEDVFYDIVRLLIDRGFIRMENYFLDGTKIEANANKYTFVWNKSVNFTETLPGTGRHPMSEGSSTQHPAAGSLLLTASTAMTGTRTSSPRRCSSPITLPRP